MKLEHKIALEGTLIIVVSIVVMIWPVSDLVILFNAPRVLIFIIPTIIAVIVLINFIILRIRMKRKNSIFNKKTIYYYTECGSTIKLEEKLCSNCGVENIKRKEALIQLEELEKNIENNKATLKKSQSNKRIIPWHKRVEEDIIELSDSHARKVKLRKMEILIGSTLEDKIKWVKTQYHDLNRSIQDIAKELDMYEGVVRHYIKMDLQNDKRENDST